MAPRRSKPAPPPRPSRTLVLDNGAHTIKAGFVTPGGSGGGDDGADADADADATTTIIDEPRVIPNCIARDRGRHTYVGSDLARCRDLGEITFRRPVEKGYVVNWEAQKEIWDHEFFAPDAPQPCDPAETRLVLTEQPNALPALQANCDQMVFEEFGFASYYRGIGGSGLVSLAPWACRRDGRTRADLESAFQRLFSMHTMISRLPSEHPVMTLLPPSCPSSSCSSSTPATPSPPSRPSSRAGLCILPSAGSTSAASS